MKVILVGGEKPFEDGGKGLALVIELYSLQPMQKFYFSLLFLPFFMTPVSAQETLWQKDLKSSTQDFLTTMSLTLDRQILLSGSSIQNKSGGPQTATNKQNNGYDYHVVKLSQEGNILWDKYFGGSRHDYLVASVPTYEGGFLLAGTSFSNQSGDKKEHNLGGSDVWVIRINENGEELWQKTLGTKSNDEASSVVQAVDQGFFVAGNISSGKNLFGSKDVFVSRLDKTGKLINTTVVGGKGLDEVQEILATPDGGSVLLIYSNSGRSENKTLTANSDSTKGNTSHPSGSETEEGSATDLLSPLMKDAESQTYTQTQTQAQTDSELIGKTEEGFGEGDYWIVKLDKNAKVEWQKTYGGKDDDRPKSITVTEQGYLIGGESRSGSSGNKKENTKEGTDIWLIMVDNAGNEWWQKSYSLGNRDVLMSLNVIRKTGKHNQSEDKGFLLGGYTQAEEKIKSDDEKFWMLYIDPVGKEEWRKHVEGKSKKKEERLVSAKLQSDGTFLLAGTSADQLGEENWKVLKLGDKDLDQLIEKQDIRIYPNPVEEYCYVEIGKSVWDENNRNEEAEIFLHDMSGRQVQSLKTRQQVTRINTSFLPQGIYVVTAQTKTKSVNTKIVKK